jgi:hypothetical protein
MLERVLHGIALLPVLLLGSAANGQTPAVELTEDIVNRAHNDALNLPGHTTNKIDEIEIIPGKVSTGKYMSVIPKPNGMYKLTVFAGSIYYGNPDFETAIANEDELVGFITGMLFHEDLHTCEGHIPMTAGADTSNSCLHAAIDYAVHQSLCEQVDALLGPPPECEGSQADRDLAVGYCIYMKELEKKWNSARGQRKIRDCASSGEYNPTPGCSDRLPPVPPSGPFTPLPPCKCC